MTYISIPLPLFALGLLFLEIVMIAQLAHMRRTRREIEDLRKANKRLRILARSSVEQLQVDMKRQSAALRRFATAGRFASDAFNVFGRAMAPLR